MKASSFSMLAAAVLAAGSSARAQDPTPPRVTRAAAGDLLVDASGMTLYVFNQDQPGRSVCNGGCAANWPPAKASKGAAAGPDFSIVTRDDGAAQWAYMGWPLYTWIKDQKPGDTTGDGFLNGAWRIARP